MANHKQQANKRMEMKYFNSNLVNNNEVYHHQVSTPTRYPVNQEQRCIQLISSMAIQKPTRQVNLLEAHMP